MKMKWLIRNVLAIAVPIHLTQTEGFKFMLVENVGKIKNKKTRQRNTVSSGSATGRSTADTTNATKCRRATSGTSGSGVRTVG